MKKVFFLLIISMMMIGCKQSYHFEDKMIVITVDGVPGVVAYSFNVPYENIKKPADYPLVNVEYVDGKWVRYEKAPDVVKNEINNALLIYFREVDFANVDCEEMREHMRSPYLESLQYTPGREYVQALKALDSARRQLSEAEAELNHAKRVAFKTALEAKVRAELEKDTEVVILPEEEP